MIIILSEEFDGPTQSVMEKLELSNANYRVIYGSDFLHDKIQIDLNSKKIIINGENIENVNIVWYRRWLSSNYRFSKEIELNDYLKNEFEEFSSNFMNYLPTKKWLNFPPYIQPFPSKSIQLKKALEFGLDVPKTVVTNCRSSLLDFFFKNDKDIITKNLSNPLVFKKEGKSYATYTIDVNNEDINDLDGDLFFPSIFQRNIEKEIEIRTFYFNGEFFSYAIFSSMNSQTTIDFRKYDFKKPNRIMKYELPDEIKYKITNLMENFNLHTGSIDLIKCIDKKFYFLEINPQGQFGGLEDYGLNIEDSISKYLIENDRF